MLDVAACASQDGPHRLAVLAAGGLVGVATHTICCELFLRPVEGGTRRPVRAAGNSACIFLVCVAR